MQVSERRVSGEKNPFRGGRPPFSLATWKRSDRLNYMLIVSVQLVLTPPQLTRPIGPSAGQEGGRNASHFHSPQGFRYAKHSGIDTAFELRRGFTSLESNGRIPAPFSIIMYINIPSFINVRTDPQLRFQTPPLNKRYIFPPTPAQRIVAVHTFRLRSLCILKLDTFSEGKYTEWANYYLYLYSVVLVRSRLL